MTMTIDEQWAEKHTSEQLIAVMSYLNITSSEEGAKPCVRFICTHKILERLVAGEKGKTDAKAAPASEKVLTQPSEDYRSQFAALQRSNEDGLKKLREELETKKDEIAKLVKGGEVAIQVIKDELVALRNECGQLVGRSELEVLVKKAVAAVREDIGKADKSGLEEVIKRIVNEAVKPIRDELGKSSWKSDFAALKGGIDESLGTAHERFVDSIPTPEPGRFVTFDRVIQLIILTLAVIALVFVVWLRTGTSTQVQDPRLDPQVPNPPSQPPVNPQVITREDPELRRKMDELLERFHKMDKQQALQNLQRQFESAWISMQRSVSLYQFERWKKKGVPSAIKIYPEHIEIMPGGTPVHPWSWQKKGRSMWFVPD